jgi:hypothetical protein
MSEWCLVGIEMSRLLRITLGVILILVGVAGTLIPIVQGWFFLALGVILLVPDEAFLHRMACRFENHFPRVRKMSE